MSIFNCKDCRHKTTENNIILTVNSNGEWALHCPKCNSDMLELATELTGQSPHNLKTYYKLEEYDNEK